ncbi:MAG: protein-ADP-ribose hydrolase [Clostridiales bacterium]|nr:protein-ADP-ribose hydrolase [Clostridiales bacterium]
MNQEQRLDFLLDILCREKEASHIAIPDSYEAKRALLRTLVNLRPPRAVPHRFLQVQDAFLQEEARQKGIVAVDTLPLAGAHPKLSLWQGDITRLQADAIVNAANSRLLGCFVPGHHCIDNAIHTAAGVQLRETCHNMMKRQGHPEPTAQAKLPDGFNLPARHIIHTVGPIITGDRPTQEQISQLSQCYTACLALAVEHHLRTVVFCCISTGEFSFPRELAAETACTAVVRSLEQMPEIQRVVFNVFTGADFSMYQKQLDALARQG